MRPSHISLTIPRANRDLQSASSSLRYSGCWKCFEKEKTKKKKTLYSKFKVCVSDESCLYRLPPPLPEPVSWLRVPFPALPLKMQREHGWIKKKALCRDFQLSSRQSITFKSPKIKFHKQSLVWNLNKWFWSASDPAECWPLRGTLFSDTHL